MRYVVEVTVCIDPGGYPHEMPWHVNVDATDAETAVRHAAMVARAQWGASTVLTYAEARRR